ncbi:hypothetical protein PMAYCL1PPCAC_04435, partial [Pristionchus mayeri]
TLAHTMLEDDDVTMAAIDMHRRPDEAALRSLFPDDDIVEEEQMLALCHLISTASTSSEPTTNFQLHPASPVSFVFVLTHEGRVHQSTAGVTGHLGFRQEEFVSQSVFNFVPVSDQSLITRLLPAANQDVSSHSPRRRERFRCAFLSRMRLDHPPREVQFEISALRCDSPVYDSRSAGCVVCVARRLPEEANKVIALSLLLDAEGIVHSVFTRNCSTHQGTFQQLVGGAFRAVVAPEYAVAAERLLTSQCESPLELDLLLSDKQFRVTATSLVSTPPRVPVRLECIVAWCTVRKPSTAFQPQLLQQQQTQIVVPPPSYAAAHETSPASDPQDALSLVCSSVFGDENMNMPASQDVAPAEKTRKKPGPKKQSKPRAKKGAAGTAATPQDSSVSSSTGDDKNSVLKSLLGAPMQHPMQMEMHPAYYNPVMYQQPQQSAAAAAAAQQQQQQMYVQQAQPNGYMVDMQQAQTQQWQPTHPQQMYYQQQMAYQMQPAAAAAAAAPAPAPTNSKKRKASNENGEKKPRGRQSAAAQAEAQRQQQAAALAAQQQQAYYQQQSQMMAAPEMGGYRYDPMQQQQMQQQLQQQQQQQHWMMQQQPGTISMQSVPQQMQPSQMSMMQQQQQSALAQQQAAAAAAAAAAAQQQQRPMQPQQQQPGSEFVRQELRQSLQAKQQLAGRPSPANAMDIAVGSVGSTGSTAGSGTFDYLSDLLSDAELESVYDFKLCSGGNGCGFDLENDDYTRKVVQHLLS